MTEFLLRIFGVRMDNAAHISGVQVVLRNSGAVGWIILLAVLLGLMTWWSYYRDAREWVSPARRRVLTALRILLFLLLLLILLRPVFAFTIEGTHDRDPIDIILHEPVVPVRSRDASIPKPLAAVIDKAIAVNPKDRYPTAGEMLAALRRVF